MALPVSFSDTAITSMMAFLVLVIILGVIIYQMTKSVVLSAGVSGVLAVVTLVVYIINNGYFRTDSESAGTSSDIQSV